METSSRVLWILLLCVNIIALVCFVLDTHNIKKHNTNLEEQIDVKTDSVNFLESRVVELHDSVDFLNVKLVRIYKLTWDNIDYWLDYFNVQHKEIVKRQIYLETGNLTSRICIENRNLFGMRMPTIRETTAIKRKYNHAMYHNYIESIEDYAIWQREFYDGKEDYYEFLKRIGYAEEPSYVRRLKTVPKVDIEVSYKEGENGMNLTVEELKLNYDKLITFIEENFKNERKDKLLKLYTDLGDRIILAPASMYKYFHNAFPGGYVIHVLNIIDIVQNVYKLWKYHGADIKGYSEEELMFSALNHDLGKIGNLKEDFYIPNDSQWHIKNQGKYYIQNPKLQHMKHADRSLFLLQSYEIRISEQEMLAIQLHDGAYDKANEFYFDAWGEDKVLKTNLVFILHQADYMAYRIEYEQWRKAKSKFYNPAKKPKEELSDEAEQKFDSLFNKIT